MRIDADIYFEESTRIRLREPLHFECGGDTHEVPTGFISDGMSIPRFFWRLLSPPVDGRTLRASVVHDYLYATGIFSRAEADRLYRKMLIADGYPHWKAWAVWTGVRIGGRNHYREAANGAS
ncbi:DUF1353 domain-containing protein [bacterium]|nr:DUF1353 domain-containing protein [bacterium]